MKKITLLIIVFFCIAAFADAQITKGSLFLGGSLNIYSNKSKPTPTSNFEGLNSNWSIRPQLGKAIANNSIAGIFLNFSGSTTKQSSTSGTSTITNNAYGGGVFYRKYFQAANRFFLFGDASLGINFNKEERVGDNGTIRFTYFNGKTREAIISITPGISFAASKKVFLEAGFGNLFSLFYQTSKASEYITPGTLANETDIRAFGAAANANGFSDLFIGIRIIIPKK